MTHSIDSTIVDLGSGNDNVVTRRQLIEADLDSHAIQRRIGTVLQPFYRGVYILGAPTRRSLLRAALEATPSAVAADFTAAGLLDLPTKNVERIHLVAPHGVTRSFDDRFALRQTRHLPMSDLSIARNYASTGLPRTICDLAAVLSPGEIQHMIEWAIVERRMTKAEFQACVRSFGRKGRPGSTLIRQLDFALLSDEPFPGSALERMGKHLFVTPELTGFIMQFAPPWQQGPKGIVDFAWPHLRVIVELDGRRWHSVTRAQVNDRRRDRIANGHGWFVLRFGWQELTERPEDVLAELGSFLAQRRIAVA